MADTNTLNIKNPFSIDTAPKPWNNDVYSDIASINATAFKRVNDLIDQKRKMPTKDIGIIFSGDIGVGKSHFIWRLCNETKQKNSDIFFATINPHIDSAHTMQYLITEIARNFSYEVDDFSGCTQFHRLVALIMQEFLQINTTAEELFRKDASGSSTITENSKKATSWLLNENINIHKKCIQFLFDCCDLETQNDAYEKLKKETESSAQEYLLTLGLLASRYQHPLVICFDQLESITDTETRAFEKIILTILGYSQGIIPFVFVRSVEWNEISTRKMDTSVVQRFGNNIISTPCSDKDVAALIKGRFQFITDAGLKKKGDAWLVTEVRKQLSQDPTPRQVLNTASAIIDPASEKQDLNSLIATLVDYFEGRERKYETITQCKKDLKFSYDVKTLEEEFPISPRVVMRDVRQWTYFAALPFGDIILWYVQKNPGKSLQYCASWLPMTDEEFSDHILSLYEQKKLFFEFTIASKGPTLLLHTEKPHILKKSEKIETNLSILKKMVCSNPDWDMARVKKELSLSKETLTDLINYCLQNYSIPVNVFSSGKKFDFKLFTADEKTLKTGYDIVNLENQEYIMIHRLRQALNWPRAVFDDLIEELEKKGVVQLQASDPGLLGTDDQKDIYVRNNSQRMLIFWRKA